MASPLPSKDGKKLFVVGSTLHGTLSRYDRRRGEFLPFFSGLSAEITTLLFQRRKVDRLRYFPNRQVVRPTPDDDRLPQLVKEWAVRLFPALSGEPRGT
jgi:hypothetical protein